MPIVPFPLSWHIYHSAFYSRNMKSINKFVVFDNVSTPKGFIVDSITANMRLDGRMRSSFRDPVLSISRCEEYCCSELSLGSTKVVTTVRGELVTPFPDRPTEGIIQFNCNISLAARSSGIYDSDVVTHLEKYIKQSEAIDMESLCVVSGKKVWLIICDVVVLDYAGNVMDASLLTTMAALRAYRRPEVSVATAVGDDIASSAQLIRHKFDDREPLPLAFHHTPISVSIGIFQCQGGDEKLLIVDVLAEEDRVCEGSIVFCVNAHREICGFHKHGGLAVSSSCAVAASKLAVAVAASLHEVLTNTLSELEIKLAEEKMRKINDKQERFAQSFAVNGGDQSGDNDMKGVSEFSDSGVIRADDPMLSFSQLHRPIDMPNRV